MALNPPNFTQIPNEILDRMHEMTPAEFKVLVAICRKTFGWHKERDIISLTQLEEMTGLSRTAVQAGIMAGIARGILERTKVGRQSFSYHLLVVSDYQSTEATSSPKLPVPVVSDYQQLVASDYTQNKDLNKLKESGGDGARARDDRLTAILENPDQTEIAVAAAVESRGDFTIADVELCEQWLDAQRPEWSGKVGTLYKLLKQGKLPTLPRTNGHKPLPQPVLTMDDVKRQSAAMIAADPELAALMKEIHSGRI